MIADATSGSIPWTSLQITLMICVAIVCVTWWNVEAERRKP